MRGHKGRPSAGHKGTILRKQDGKRANSQDIRGRFSGNKMEKERFARDIETVLLYLSPRLHKTDNLGRFFWKRTATIHAPAGQNQLCEENVCGPLRGRRGLSRRGQRSESDEYYRGLIVFPDSYIFLFCSNGHNGNRVTAGSHIGIHYE